MSDQSDQLRALTTELLSLHVVLDSVGAYIFTKDCAGRYTFANTQVCALFGAPLEDIIGKDDSQFFDLDKSNAIRENDRRVLDLGETISEEEVNIIKPSGATRVYWTVKQPVRNAAGQIIGMSGISSDITERKQLERELDAQRDMLNTVLNNVEAAVYMKDRSGRYLYVNHETAALFGCAPDEVLGRKDIELMRPDLATACRALDARLFASGVKQAGEELVLAPDGQIRHFWSVKVPFQHDTLIGISTDVTELNALKEELQRQAYTDMLTGVSNRRHFFLEAGKEFAKSRRYGHALSVILLDIDHFKKVNDQHGHQAGDIILCEVSQHCQRAIRECDVFGRIGGEEFAILLPNTDLEAASALGERLRAALRSMRIEGDWAGAIEPSASFGVAIMSPADKDFPQLLVRADKALYQAKETGRNKVCIAA